MKTFNILFILTGLSFGLVSTSTPAKADDDITQSSFEEQGGSADKPDVLSISVGADLTSTINDSWTTTLGITYQSFNELPTDLSANYSRYVYGDTDSTYIDADVKQTIKKLKNNLEVVVVADYAGTSSGGTTDLSDFGIDHVSGIAVGILDNFLKTDKSSLRGYLCLALAKDQYTSGTVSSISGSDSYSYIGPQLFASFKYSTKSGIQTSNDLRARVSLEDTSYSYTTSNNTVSFPIDKRFTLDLALGITYFSDPPDSSDGNIDMTSSINISYSF
jgi:putative salt-induced outer membrane protein YdiY